MRELAMIFLALTFLSVAAGSILYVVVQLLGVGLRSGSKEVLYWGLFAGLAAGFLTDMVVTAGPQAQGYDGGGETEKPPRGPRPGARQRPIPGCLCARM